MARVDRASRQIKATPQAIYRAHLDPDAVAAWRPPEGMKAEIEAFEPREGGVYRMAFVYLGEGQGKSSEKADVFEGRFAELVQDRKIVEQVVFESEDPAFAGTMTITTTLTPTSNGTEVAVAASDVPTGISPEDHHEGMSSSLANLAAFVER
jgi:uncharacterized protein YndB with AHSA1/START domain